MFGFFSKANANSTAYKTGQIWVVKSGDYKGAKVIIVNVEDHPVQNHVIHIMVQGPIQNLEGKVTSNVSHLPYSEEGLRKSNLKLSRKNADVPDEWREGYEIWNAEASKGKAGIFTITVPEAIDFAFQQMPQQSKPDTKLMDPNDIAYSDYQHESFSDEFLSRIRTTTDAFEEIDGISFEQAVDLYRRDVDPETNIVIWEEMARVFNAYCEKKCPDLTTKKDVYNTLLVASMFPKDEVLARVNAENLMDDEIMAIASSYSLKPLPISVYKE